MKLHEITDSTPTLIAIIERYLEKGRAIYWGGGGKTIKSVSTGSTGCTLHFNYPTPTTKKQTYGIHYSSIDKWELVPEGDGFRLKMRQVPVAEGKDDDAPMLVRLIAQRLAKGEEVGIDIHVGSAAGGRMRFTHRGDIISIELKHGVSKDVQRLTGGNENGVYLAYRNNRLKLTTIVLNPVIFDDVYTLKQFDPANKDHGWILTDAVEEGKRHYEVD